MGIDNKLCAYKDHNGQNPLPLEDFHKSNKSKDGRHSYCKTCKATIRALDPEKYRKSSNNWAKRNKDYRGEYSKNYNKENKEKIKFKEIKRLYGLSREEYLDLVKKQNNLCAICKSSPNSGRHKKNIIYLFVDHDHFCCPGKKSCGKCVRGLLCNKCNMGLSNFDDNLDFLSQAIKYLYAVDEDIEEPFEGRW